MVNPLSSHNHVDLPTVDGLDEPVSWSTVPSDAITFDDAAVELGGRTIWSHGSFSLPTGEFVGLIGPNGAGKTTLLRVLLGQIRPSHGQVRVLGAPARRGNRAVGYVPQHRTMELDLAVRAFDFVMLGLTGHRWGFGRTSATERRAVEEALAAVDATNLAEEPVGVLSGGEQQRLRIAQALVTQPQLLLLDEPLASLDLRSRHEIVDLVDRIRRERRVTVLFVTHDLNLFLGVLDRVVYLLDCRPVAASLEEVVRPDILSRLYRAQVRIVRTTDGQRFITGV